MGEILLLIFSFIVLCTTMAIMYQLGFDKGYKSKTNYIKSDLRKILFDLGLDLNGDVFAAINVAKNKMIWVYINSETGYVFRSTGDTKSPDKNFDLIFPRKEDSKCYIS